MAFFHEGITLPALTRWGLSINADLVYRTIAGSGPLSTSDLAVQLGLRIRIVRAACEELAACGAIRGGIAEGGRLWTAQPPGQFLAIVRDWHLAAVHAGALERQRRNTSAGHGRVMELVGAVASGGVTYLQGATAVRGRIAQLAAAERVEHLAMSPEPVYDPDSVAAAMPLDLDLLSRGVRLRTLEHTSAAGDAFVAHSGELSRLGAEQRVLGDVPAKMIIYDRHTALLPIDPADASLGAVEITVPTVVDALVAMFLQAWDRSTAYGGTAAGPLSAREQAVARLLLEGDTDSVIARKLVMSTRTVQYTIKSVMDRLGVNTRFALGHALGRLEK